MAFSLLAIGVVQCNFCSPFILQWSLTCDEDHPYNKGLSILNVPKLLKKSGLHQLFSTESLMASKLKSFFVQENISNEPFRKMAEQRAFKHFKIY